MEKYLRPESLDIDPKLATAEDEWEVWISKFEAFLTAVATSNDLEKLTLLRAHLSCSSHKYTKSAKTYEEAVKLLSSRYVKPKSDIFARHCLFSRKQNPDESLDSYLEALKSLSAECNYKDAKCDVIRDEAVRDSFINGVTSHNIRQRLLENLNLSLEETVTQALALERAQLQSEAYGAHHSSFSTKIQNSSSCRANADKCSEHDYVIAAVAKPKCGFCGGSSHPRSRCGARNATCHKCGKTGHFSKVCRSKSTKPTCVNSAYLSAISASITQGLKSAVCKVEINGSKVEALVDTGSTRSFIKLDRAKLLDIKLLASSDRVYMADTQHQAMLSGECRADIKVNDDLFPDFRFAVLKDLCAPVLLGHDFLMAYDSITVKFGGKKPNLELCSLIPAVVEAPSLFGNLKTECRPIQTKSRRRSKEEATFIRAEVSRLLKEQLITPSNSPWRAQVLIVSNERGKKRMVIDYSQTINRFTELNAYPLPRINEMIDNVSQYAYFSTIDLREAYHQIALKPEECKYTAFEADGKLFEFKRIPFGVTNGVACFQKILNDFIQDENLRDTFAYVDDVVVCGKTQSEHDANLNKFMMAAKRYCFTVNYEKCNFNTRSVKILGHVIEKCSIRPDPDRLRALLDLPKPSDRKSLRRAVGMLSHYSKWIPSFSEKLRPLVDVDHFPLSADAGKVFEEMKQDIARATLAPLDDNAQFVVETDASDNALAATLSQNGKPVAFFSRTLNSAEKHHSAIEKEAAAIVESIRRWRHLLIGKNFQLITDQRSVSFMFDQVHRGKIKNDKIARWRLELAAFSYDISYRPGRLNIAPDTLSRFDLAASVHVDTLSTLHENLCHPGITRLWHFVKTRNLPFSLDDVKNVIGACRTCARFKPRFVKSISTLIKATRPFEKLSLDFKGPLPSASRNTYLFVIVDEYSRFPFAYATQDTSSETAIRCLTNLFSVFGMPECVHSDRGTGFSSRQFRQFLLTNSIAQSFTTAYNPQGNGQVERYNGVLWNALQMTCHSRGLKVCCWEQLLPVALHSLRSLLCTATNTTPHERLFRYDRRSASGKAFPTWLMTCKKALLKCIRGSKYEPSVQEVEIIHLNPSYAKVRLPNERETLVSLRHLAPIEQQSESFPVGIEETVVTGTPHRQAVHSPGFESTSVEPMPAGCTESSQPASLQSESVPDGNVSDEIRQAGDSTGRGDRPGRLSPPSRSVQEAVLRRSTRARHPPTRLVDYEC